MSPKGQPKDRLAEYRRKRSADSTPEPFVGAPHARGLFVVQKHAATRLHYDLRLEMHGALQSWAVPKGPSFDPTVKRMAVEVEEHPLEYAWFEGMIPEGNYGAGAVIVWDRGRWEAVEDPEEGMQKGKLLFDLHGHKLRGRWTLFRTKSKSGKQNEWLLMKKPDAYADPDVPPGEESIQSGLTIEELREGVDPGDKVLRLLARGKSKGSKRGDVDIHRIAPMLAEAREQPFTDDDWLFELKYDGYRLMAAKDGEDVVLRYRRGQDVTALYPEIAAALERLLHDRIVIDGELVALDDEGKPSFQLLQQRVHLKRPADIARASIERPTTMFVFDILAYGDRDLRGLSLLERKKILRDVLPRYNPLRYSDHIEAQGEAMYEQVREMRLEGILAKRADSKYVEGRSGSWLKIRADRTGDFAIVGFSPAKGARAGFGALHLAVHEGDGLIYAGRVGSGFDQRLLNELHRQLEPTIRDDPPCGGPVPKGDVHTWVEPHMCCEVRYKEWTSAGHLRQPVFLRLREDKPVEDCVRVDPQPERAEPEGVETLAPAPVERTISFTNLTKVFWPEDGTTKGDLIEYHRKISPWLLPYLADRPLVLTRYPDGIEGKHFFQKDAPGYAPDWIRTEVFWSEHAKREIHYFICDDEETLLYLINLGTIPLHLWASRMATLQTPDWCILDLDPKQASFAHVITIARYIKKLCDEIGYECFVKTSGSTGLHVLLPLAGQLTFEQSRQLGHLFARIVADALPEIATIARAMAARGDRVYIDFLQNGHGKLLVSPYCVRPLPGAPVSVPLRWTEVKKGLDIRKFTIKNAPARAKRLKQDPLLLVLDAEPDLQAVLQELAGRLD